ncbi:MAG TPA: NAD-dependent epimerase, partial [Afipia sp.]
KAASGFFSNIIREPLNGEEAVLPVAESLRHWFASPRAAVRFLLHAATLPGETVGPRRTISLPGLSATVGEEIAALEKIAGRNVVSRIRREPDPAIANIVNGWPTAFDAKRAHELGFTAEKNFEEIIHRHIEDELGGTFVK